MNIKQDNDLNIVVVGHVDHGKSTVIGRLFADTDSLPKGKLEQIKEMCKRNSKPFEYAFLLDALKDERSQGITIDTARSFFKTDKRKYILIDAPGHIEFLKNMITGASRAEAALLVIDAKEGVRENSRRHGYMLSMLGISQIAVLVNKMDLVDYDKTVYDNIVAEYTDFLAKINIKPKCFIPISAMQGDNIASASINMPWYNGFSVLQTLDEFDDVKLPDDLPFRMPVQDIYKFTASGDDRRIVAGTIDTGSIGAGDEIIFYPSGKKTTVKNIEVFNRPPMNTITAGYAAGFTVKEQIYIKRGELCVRADQPKPLVSTMFKASIFWLGKVPMRTDRTYYIKIAATKEELKLRKIVKIINAASLDEVKNKSDSGVEIKRHEVAECIFETMRPIAFDTADMIQQTSRFVIVDEYEISGGGIITENITDDMSEIRKKVLIRNVKWEQGSITPEMRAERYCQHASAIIITGNRNTNKKAIAKTLEKNLFDNGRFVYYLGIGNILYGVDSDIKNEKNNTDSVQREEHMRRLAEVSNILLETGAILIITATMMTGSDIDIIRTVIPEELIRIYWIGDSVDTDIEVDHVISEYDNENKAAVMIKNDLQNRNVIFKP